MQPPQALLMVEADWKRCSPMSGGGNQCQVVETNVGWWEPMSGGGNQLWVKFSPAEFGTLLGIAQQPEGLLTNGDDRRIQREKLV